MKRTWLPETIGRELKHENGIENAISMSRAKVLMFADKVFYRSLKHNADGSFEIVKQEMDPDRLFDELGMKPDMDKIRWYLLLDELF